MLTQIIGAAASLLEMSTEMVMATKAGSGPEVMYTQQIGMTQKETSVMLQLLCMVTGRAIAARQRASANQTETAVEILAELLMETGTMVTGTELGNQTEDIMKTGVVTGHSTMETGGRRGAADSETLLGAMPAQLSESSRPDSKVLSGRVASNAVVHPPPVVHPVAMGLAAPPVAAVAQPLRAPAAVILLPVVKADDTLV